MFDRVRNHYNAQTESDEFRQVLTEAAQEDMGLTNDSGLPVDEEDLFVDPDSVPKDVLAKVFAAADDVNMDDLDDGELSELLSEEDLNDVE